MRTLVRILSLFPLNALYALMQGVVYPLLYYIVQYRRKVVKRNLSLCFPTETDSQRKRREKDFYHWFADLLAEIIYGYRITEKEIRERVVFHGAETLEAEIRAHGGGFIMLGHYGCWEWLADICNRMPDDFHSHVIYRTLKSKSADKLMHELREKRGCDLIDKNLLLRHMLQNRRTDGAHIYYMLSDQKPSKHDLGHWVSFLGQDTPFITGTETLARKFNYPVYYADIRMPKRGHYETFFRTIAIDSPATAEGEITDRFAAFLEENILRDPKLWLWTHNRFKWRREDSTRPNTSKHSDLSQQQNR